MYGKDIDVLIILEAKKEDHELDGTGSNKSDSKLPIQDLPYEPTYTDSRFRLYCDRRIWKTIVVRDEDISFRF